MEIVLGILFNLFMLASLLIIGNFFRRLIPDIPVAGTLALGFLIWFGISAAFCIPVFSMHGSKTVFLILLGAVYIALMILGFTKIKSLREIFDRKYLCFIIPLIFTLAVAGVILVLQRTDADDSFYVSLARLFQESPTLNPYDPSMGFEDLAPVPIYDFSIWECVAGSLSLLFGINVASLMHTYCIPWLLLVSASGFLCLGEIFFKDSKKASAFYLFTLLLHVFGGYSVFSEGSFLLSRIWQGKAIYLTVIIPIMVSLILLSDKILRRFLLPLGFIFMLSGVGLNQTALYVVGFLALFLSLAVAVFEKNPRPLMILPGLIIIAGTVTWQIYIRSSAYPGQVEASSSADFSFINEVFLNFFGRGSGLVYCALFIAVIIFVLIKGDKKAKSYFVLVPAFAFVFLLNPVSGSFVAANITKTPSYWRVYWILPLVAGLSYGAVLLLSAIKKRQIIVIASIFLCIAFCLPGKFMFTGENGFFPKPNTEGINPDNIYFGENIEDGAVILAPFGICTEIRQVYPGIKVLYSRNNYMADLYEYRGRTVEHGEIQALYYYVNHQIREDIDMGTLLNKYRVDYIAIPNGHTEIAKEIPLMGYKQHLKGQDFTLFKRQ